MQTRQMLYALALASLGLALPTPGVQAQTGAVRGATRTASARTNDITAVQVLAQDGATRIVIEGTRAFTPEVSVYNGNTIIAVPGVWRAGKTGVRPIRKNGVAFVNCVQFAVRPKPIVRIVANNQREQSYELQATDSPSVWEVVLRDTAATASPDAAETKLETPSSEPLVLVKPEKDEPAPAGDLLALLSPTREALLQEVAFAPLVHALSSPLLTQEPLQRPGTSLLALPAEPAPEPGKLAPVVVTLPEAGTSLPPLGAVPTRPNSLVAAAGVSSRAAEGGAPATRIAAAPAAEKKVALSPAPKRQEGDVARQIVSVDMVDTDLVAVLKAIAKKSGVNIVVAPSVTGKVTVSLEKVTVLEALNQIARISKFRYAQVGQTFFVGSAADIGSATQAPDVGEIMNASIAFFYSNGDDLKKSIEQALPNVTITLVGASAESKTLQADPSAVLNGAPGATQGGQQTVKTTPRGGVINIVGTMREIKLVRLVIESTEQEMVRSSIRQAEFDAERARGNDVEVYRVRNSEPESLITLMKDLAPTVSVRLGATPSFVGVSGGGSVAFASGGSGGSAGGSTGAKATTLVLTGAAADVRAALEKLEKIDVRVAMLIFEAKIVEVNNDDRNRLGLSYDFTRPVTVGEQNLGNSSVGPNGAGATGGARRLEGGAIFRTPYSIGLTLAALDQAGKTRILASPTLTALDNSAAISFTGEEIKYVVNIQQTPVGAAVQTDTAKAGITLKVVGRTRPNNEIELLVHPEVSVIKGFLQPAGTSISLPQIATRYVDTMVRVKDGETIAIGGLLSEQDVINMSRVPLLSSIPFFGKLFENREKNKTHTELMVFITSRIVQD